MVVSWVSPNSSPVRSTDPHWFDDKQPFLRYLRTGIHVAEKNEVIPNSWNLTSSIHLSNYNTRFPTWLVLSNSTLSYLKTKTVLSNFDRPVGKNKKLEFLYFFNLQLKTFRLRLELFNHIFSNFISNFPTLNFPFSRSFQLPIPKTRIPFGRCRTQNDKK